MRVMIAVDGSNLSDVVLQEAASRPWPAGTEFSAVTAVDPFFFTRAPLLLEEAKHSSLQGIEEQIKPLKDATQEICRIRCATRVPESQKVCARMISFARAGKTEKKILSAPPFARNKTAKGRPPKRCLVH